MSYDFPQSPRRGLDNVRETSIINGTERNVVLSEGAANLLTKAITALQFEDEAKADALIRRACALPYDGGSGSHPGLWGAHQLLFTVVTDALERSGDEDSSWLDVAIEVLDTLDEVGHRELAATLTIMAGDSEQMSDDERRRIRAEVPIVTTDDLLDPGPDASLDDLVAEAKPMVVAAAAYATAISQRRAYNLARRAMQMSIEDADGTGSGR